MSDVNHKFEVDRPPEFSKSGSPARRQSSEHAYSAVRHFEAAQRSKVLFDDEAEIDLSGGLEEDATLALLCEQCAPSGG